MADQDEIFARETPASRGSGSPPGATGEPRRPALPGNCTLSHTVSVPDLGRGRFRTSDGRLGVVPILGPEKCLRHKGYMEKGYPLPRGARDAPGMRRAKYKCEAGGSSGQTSGAAGDFKALFHIDRIGRRREPLLPREVPPTYPRDAPPTFTGSDFWSPEVGATDSRIPRVTASSLTHSPNGAGPRPPFFLRHGSLRSLLYRVEGGV